jgi:capsular exopolysaccharide synthesis family protein
MGRVAEALKKAQQEREEKLRLGLSEASVLWARRPAGAGDFPEAVRGHSSEASLRGAPRIAAGPELKKRGRRAFLPSRRRASPMGPTPHWEVHPTVVAVRERSSSITEQYRAVRTWLLSRNTTGERSCIAVTSSVPREGKSVTVANLAAVMAEVRHLNVLAVDTDFRQAYLPTLFKLPNSPGLADVLAGRATLDESIAETPLGNLAVLPAGTCQDLSPAELINSTAAARVFEEIRERYHFVLVDTPPVQWVSDVGVIGALCTGILMVVRMNKTPANMVRQSVHWLRSNNLNVIGCIAAACSAEAARSGYREPNADD